jgi:two-component system, NarL family, sensor kinase
MFDQNKSLEYLFLLIIVLLVILFCAFIIFIVVKYQQKQTEYYRNIEALKTLHQNTVLQSQIEIQENTFDNIAKEIHDNIGQKLTLSKLYLNTLQLNNIQASAIAIQHSIELLSSSIAALSDISRNMSTELLEENGLVRVIQSEINKLNSIGIFTVDFAVQGNEFYLNSKTETILFRIVQEALNNIIKHAQATNIQVEFRYATQDVTIVITDNGIGLPKENKATGNGLLNMKKRAQLLNGSFNIESLQQGTTITIQIPKDANNN